MIFTFEFFFDQEDEARVEKKGVNNWPEFDSYSEFGDFEDENSFMHLESELDESFSLECEDEFQECAVLIDDFIFLQNNEDSIKTNQDFALRELGDISDPSSNDKEYQGYTPTIRVS